MQRSSILVVAMLSEAYGLARVAWTRPAEGSTGPQPGPDAPGTGQRSLDPAAQGAAAATYYAQALMLAEARGMRPLQAHCHLGLGTLYATAGEAEQARAALSTAIAMYRAMAMAFWLPETEAALAQVEGR